MNRLKATVRNGHLVSDDTVDFPEGSEVESEIVDDLSDMDPEDRAALEAALDESEADVKHGRLIDNEEVLSFLRRSRRRDRSVDPSGEAPTR